MSRPIRETFPAGCAIEALAAQTKRAPLIVQGDFHATAAGTIVRSGELALARPVDVVMSAALGTGDMAFPSAVRSVESKPSQLVGMDEALKPTEKNGFTGIRSTQRIMSTPKERPMRTLIIRCYAACLSRSRAGRATERPLKLRHRLS